MKLANTIRLQSPLTKLLLLLVVGGGILALAGCDSLTNYEEINTDPNNPQDAPEHLMLPALQAAFTYEVWANEPARTTTLWVQQLTQNANPPSFDTYQYNNADGNNLWEFFLYTGTIKDAHRLKEQAEENGNRAYAGVAKIYEAWSWAVLTDLFDDVPYGEAFAGSDNPTPAYDDQATIYENVFRLLEEAVQDLEAGNETPLALGDGDLVYGGDTESWQRLAHTLRAKYYIRLTEAGSDFDFAGSDRAARAQNALDALADGLQGNDDNAVFAFPGGGNAENPWYQFTIEGVWVTTQQLSRFYVELLKENGDLRLPVQARQVGAIDSESSPPNSGAEGFQHVAFDPGEHFALTDSTYVGHQNGADTGVNDARISSIGEFFSAEDAPVFLQTYAEAKLLEAEAHHILGATGSARTALEDGIRASLEQHEVTGAENIDQALVDDFVSNRLQAFDDASDPLEVIIIEKYIANFLTYEPYNDWRRTGYPVIERVPNAVQPVVPQRLPYPNSELNNNADNVPSKGTGGSALQADVAWDPIQGDGL